MSKNEKIVRITVEGVGTFDYTTESFASARVLYNLLRDVEGIERKQLIEASTQTMIFEWSAQPRS